VVDLLTEPPLRMAAIPAMPIVDATNDSNANPDDDTIEFDLPEPAVITLTAPLPTITDAVLIDGRPSPAMASRRSSRSMATGRRSTGLWRTRRAVRDQRTVHHRHVERCGLRWPGQRGQSSDRRPDGTAAGNQVGVPPPVGRPPSAAMLAGNPISGNDPNGIEAIGGDLDIFDNLVGTD
jgi:hypothetical protein